MAQIHVNRISKDACTRVSLPSSGLDMVLWTNIEEIIISKYNIICQFKIATRHGVAASHLNLLVFVVGNDDIHDRATDTRQRAQHAVYNMSQLSW